MEIQELERRAIARDLHDEIGQALTAIKLNLRELGDNLTAAVVGKQVSDSLLILDQVLRHIRNLALDLRPSMLDELGLLPALRWYVGRQAERAGWTLLKFMADEVVARPSPEVEISCFRLTQEALRTWSCENCESHCCGGSSRGRSRATRSVHLRQWDRV